MPRRKTNLDVRRLITASVIEVFSTMFSFQAKPVAKPPPHSTSRIAGCVGIAGSSIGGSVYIHLPEKLARAAAAELLEIEAEKLVDGAAVNDLVGELCNVITGTLKAALSRAGNHCASSPPTVIRGSAFAIETPLEVAKTSVAFVCRRQYFTVEVYLTNHDRSV